MSDCRMAGQHPPLGAVWYAEYSSNEEIEKFTAVNRDVIQKIFRNFGTAQKPDPADYPDGVDIPLFLTRIANTKL